MMAPIVCVCVHWQYMAGDMKVDEFITHRYPLSEINEAFHVMHAGESIRAVLDMA